MLVATLQGFLHLASMAAYSGGWLGFGGFGRRGEEDLGGGLKEDVASFMLQGSRFKLQV